LSWYGDQYRFVYSTNVSGALYCYYANFILLRKKPKTVSLLNSGKKHVG
jgi:hypothetical protein